MSNPTTCTCEGDMAWNEGIPHTIRLTNPDCPEHQEDQ